MSNPINDAIKRYRDKGLSMLVTDITDEEIVGYLVRMTQDLRVPEAERMNARDALVVMLMNREPPSTLPVFLRQEEMAHLEALLNASLLHTSLPDALAQSYRTSRRAITRLMIDPPKPSFPTLAWEAVGRGHKDQWFVDVPNVGRYLVRREAPRKPFRAYLNARKTDFVDEKADNVKAMVERTVRARNMAR